MKKKISLLIPLLLILFLLIFIVIFSKQHYETILYKDGTLIIDENTRNRNKNIEKHGDILNSYPSTKDKHYLFEDNEDQPWHNEANQIKHIKIDSAIQPVSCAFWFSKLYYVEDIDVSNIDTSKVTTMAYMFEQTGTRTKSFQITGLSTWDTSNVTDMQWMFRAAGDNAETFILDVLDGWNTSKVTKMAYMFNSAGSHAKTWKIGNLSNWNTSQVIYMDSMFAEIGPSESRDVGDLRSWNTDNSNALDMFTNEYELAPKYTSSKIWMTEINCCN